MQTAQVGIMLTIYACSGANVIAFYVNDQPLNAANY